MGLYDFSFKADERETARAQVFDLDASYKDLGQVLRAIKGKHLPQARKILQECVDMKMPIEYRKFNTGFGHRSQLGGKKGRFPVKEAKMALSLLANVEANANYKGLPVDQLIVRQAAAYKQNVMRRYRKVIVNQAVLGYGKTATWANYVTCRAEIVLAKDTRPKKEKKKPKTPKGGEQGKTNKESGPEKAKK